MAVAASTELLVQKALLFARTVRYLKPTQIWGRLARLLYRPSCDLRPAPDLHRGKGAWCQPIAKQPSMVGPTRFKFLNVEREIGSPGDWAVAEVSALWAYNLHYFDDLISFDADKRGHWHRELIANWIADNPPGAGVGWEPYPLSLRIVNWVKWELAGNALNEMMRQSLAVQARWLSRRLEFHLLGNHLIANAKALVFAGLFFDGEEAGRWLQRGIRILLRQLQEQILADGGHFERSPMYHHIVLEDVLDLINMFRWRERSPPPALVERLPRMAYWSQVMQHPDGDLPFFNDCAFGIASKNDELRAYASRLGLDWGQAPASSVFLAHSGYARLVRGPFTVLADVAPIGPDHLPGHAHADTLSLEMSVGKSRVLVNSGTSIYAVGKERLRQRGTAAHNTVRLDRRDSSEVWSAFRVARRARVSEIQFDAERGRIEAQHSGYQRLAGAPTHRRLIAMQESGLEIVDEIVGSATHFAEGFFHFHPDIKIASKSAGSPHFSISWDDGQRRRTATVAFEGADRVRVDPDSTWHPQFGISVPAACLVYERMGPLPLRVVTRFQIDM